MKTSKVRHLKLIQGGAGMPAEPQPSLRERLAPIPRWQLVLALLSKVVLLGSLYYLIRG